ncbi:MAG: hypothetical protein AAF543_22495 [Pseudomonadota bacterium]
MNETVQRNWSWWRSPNGKETVSAEAEGSEIPSPPSPILEVGSGLLERYRISGAPSFMFISLFGMAGEAIADRASLVDDELAQQSLIPVYLVDEAEFKPFRSEQRLFEYLPSLWQGSRRAPDLDWPFYLRRRYLLLQAKWQPIGRIDFGDIPDWLPEHYSIPSTEDAKNAPAIDRGAS